MALYFVAALSNGPAIVAKAKEIAGEADVHQVQPDKFFIRFGGTSPELSEKLGIASGEVGTGIVLLVSAYHGRGPTSMWEWVTQKLGAQ